MDAEWKKTDPILMAFAEVARFRLEMEWVWVESGYDYRGDLYQASQIAHDEAVRRYNITVLDYPRAKFPVPLRPCWA